VLLTALAESVHTYQRVGEAVVDLSEVPEDVDEVLGCGFSWTRAFATAVLSRARIEAVCFQIQTLHTRSRARYASVPPCFLTCADFAQQRSPPPLNVGVG
jgi:hypothetical protein